MSWQSGRRNQLRKKDGLSGAQLIAEERLRQTQTTSMGGEGYNSAHDHNHQEELALAAAAYAIPKAMGFQRSKFWPWHRNYWKPNNDRVVELTKAGALIAAAIDEILRQLKEKEEKKNEINPKR